MRLSEKETHDALSSCISIEYSRDSPMFRQQINAFEETFSLFSSYCHGVTSAFQELEKSMSLVENAQSKLKIALTGGATFGRCLFTNIYPNISDLAATLQSMGTVLNAHNISYIQIREKIANEILPKFQELAREDLTKEKQMKHEMENAYFVFESLLSSSLNTRHKCAGIQTAKIIEARSEFELKRFDLIEQLNMLDCKKKLTLTQAVCELFDCYKASVQIGQEVITSKEVEFGDLQREVVSTSAVHESQVLLWRNMRQRLASELNGCLPPPGAPPGAFSPVQPRNHLGMPVYTVQLTTELLTSNTREAAYEDNRHARDDDGVFKQGYLFIPGIFKKTRKWHRLYATKLYTVEVVSNAPSCNMSVVCDVLGATICAKPGGIPHKFIIALSDGRRVELQAENEDEMVKWICGIRRCSVGVMGRPTLTSRKSRLFPKDSEVSNDDSILDFDSSDALDSNCIDDSSSLTPTTPTKIASNSNTNIVSTTPNNLSLASSPLVRECSTAQLLAEFVIKNNCCAECGAEPVCWISTSLGVTVCEDCAITHRQLTWAVSKLKNIRLDEFSEGQMAMLTKDLGNINVNNIWEISVLEGWSKPTPQSSIEDKAQYILAKYRWYAFVDEVRLCDSEEMTCGLKEASIAGNIQRVAWWLSHKADVNSCNVDKRTPLHEAVTFGHANLVCFLLQNGSDLFAKDTNGITPYELSCKMLKNREGDVNTLSRICDMMVQIQKGEY